MYAGAVLMIPGITGFDSMVQLARDDAFALPILAHPALLGSHVRAGFSHRVLFGTLCRLAGADASIFPNYGGRFGFSQVRGFGLVYPNPSQNPNLRANPNPVHTHTAHSIHTETKSAVGGRGK